MLKRAEAWLLTVLRVPPEPAPPAGAPGSLRVFRAGRNYLRLRWVSWAGAQVAATFGLMVSLYFAAELQWQLRHERAVAAQEAAIEVAKRAETADATALALADAEMARLDAERERRGLNNLMHRGVPRAVRKIAMRLPESAPIWINVFEFFGVIGFGVQFCWSLASVWLDYALRWYMVTDRSLRLRSGILKIQESTMSFANLQQVTVQQGPLQRLLKLADVEVRSAGGGATIDSHGRKIDSMHTSTFHAVENASEIRDLILERLKRFQQAGLGEPDDHNHAEAVGETVVASGAGGRLAGSDTLAAANEVLAEVRAWRAQVRR